MDRPTCETCRWWDVAGSRRRPEDLWECRRFPPTHLDDEGVRCGPLMFGDDFCGEHAPEPVHDFATPTSCFHDMNRGFDRNVLRADAAEDAIAAAYLRGLEDAAKVCERVEAELCDETVRDGTIKRMPDGGIDATPAEIAAQDCAAGIRALSARPTVVEVTPTPP